MHDDDSNDDDDHDHDHDDHVHVETAFFDKRLAWRPSLWKAPAWRPLLLKGAPRGDRYF